MEARRRSWSRNDSDGLGPGRWRTRQCRTRRPVWRLVCRANLRKGQEAADGSATAATVIRYRRDNSRVIIDIGGGYGGGVVLRLKDNGIEPTSFNGANESTEKTKDGQLPLPTSGQRHGGNSGKRSTPTSPMARQSVCTENLSPLWGRANRVS